MNITKVWSLMQYCIQSAQNRSIFYCQRVFLKNIYTFLGYSILESKNLKNLHCASDACVGFNYSWLILVKVDFQPKEFKA